MHIPAFSISGIPRIIFADGAVQQLPKLMAGFGRQALVMTGASSFTATANWPALVKAMAEAGIAFEHATVAGEPSPQMVDEIAASYRNTGISVVLAIGGGSVLDAAKAVAGLLNIENSVMDFLEGVGPELPYVGPAVPFIAVPTTAGTGSEATKNAVLSHQGADGFKKSFRHDKLVAQYAVIDPELLASCPKSLVAANGMDAFTQLLESYVSTRANPMTDALAISGIRAVKEALPGWYFDHGDIAVHRAGMAYAALLSGVTLAQVGLGSVHGLAAPLGAFFPMPHGVVCGTLVAECTRVNISLLRQRAPQSSALERYSDVGRILLNEMGLDKEEALTGLVSVLESWTSQLQLPALSAYGMTEADIPRVVANCRGSSMKTNPLVLSDDEVAGILYARL